MDKIKAHAKALPVEMRLQILENVMFKHFKEDFKNQVGTFYGEYIKAQTTPIPEYADLMTVEEFIERVVTGSITDNDGHGFYVTNDLIYSMFPVNIGSTYNTASTKKGFTHVAWFNK